MAMQTPWPLTVPTEQLRFALWVAGLVLLLLALFNSRQVSSLLAIPCPILSMFWLVA